MNRKNFSIIACLAMLLSSQLALASEPIKLTSIGPIAFGPEGVLLVSDPMAATIYAAETGDTKGDPDSVDIKVEGVKSKIAGMLGAEPNQVRIMDIAVNPNSGNVYFSVAKGSNSIVLKLDAKSKKMTEFVLDSSDDVSKIEHLRT